MARNTKTPTAQAAAQTFTAVEDTNGEDIGMWDNVRSMAKLMGVEVPTGKRALWGSVTAVAVTILGTYSGMQLAGYMAVGAIMLTGSTFHCIYVADPRLHCCVCQQHDRCVTRCCVRGNWAVGKGCDPYQGLHHWLLQQA